MRNLMIAFLLFSTLEAIGQVYTPLINDYNEWHVTNCSSVCNSNIYYTDGDTIVEGHSYKILDGFHYIMRSILIREEVMNRKVYLRFIPSDAKSTEYLLYDFSLNIGDSINLYNFATPYVSEPGYFTLDSIDLKPLVDGNNYRHFYLSANDPVLAQTNNAIWIEGVGSRTLISGPGSYPDINQAGQLSCFYKDVDLFYAQTDSIEGCDSKISTASINSISDGIQFKVFPTITTDYLNIESNELIDDVRIIDMSGSIVLNNHIGSLKTSIDCSKLQAGLYLITVLRKGQSSTPIRFIKK